MGGPDMPKLQLTGKVALVTGAKQGIGRCVALLLAQCGADVAVLDLSLSAQDEVCAAIAAEGVRCLPISASVTDEAAVQGAMATIKAQFGRLDILVNNAGITKDALSKKMSIEQFRQVLDVNLVGSFLCAQQAMALMREGGEGGTVINFSSVVGISGNIGQANYSASKSGILGLTKSLAKEGAKDQIRVNAVAPGFIETPMTQTIPAQLKEAMIGRIPLARIGQPEDVANAVLYFASDLASYITGQCLMVNGGQLM